MPLYEYVCRDCGNQFEIRQSIRDEALTICPTCGGPIRRKVHPVGIVFKGSGFYKTDSRSSSEAGAAPSERTTETTPAAATDASTSSSTPAAAASGETSSSPVPKPASSNGSTPAT